MIAIIDITLSFKQVKSEVTSEHLWFDVKSKNLIKLQGGELDFQYDGKELKVGTKKVYNNKTIANTNKDIIKQWIESNSEFDLQVQSSNEKYIAVEFPDNFKEEVEDSLYSHRFSYEIL